MKQKLFYLAAVLMFIACSTDQIVEVSENPADLISFRPYINNVTRAADVTTDNLTTFKVNARKTTGDKEYFRDAVFTGSSTTPFTCSTKHYWPQSEALDFYAYSPTSNTQVSVDETDYYKKFTVTPSTTIDEQVDFVFAATKNKTKEGSISGGITLNFRHTGAKIACKVKNSSSTLKFDVEGWKIGYLSPTGTFTFADDNTDVQNTGTGTTLTFGQWGSHTAAAVGTEYVSTLATTNIAANAEPTLLGGEMIIVPQTLTAATAYASTDASAKLNGSFIAVKLKIKNNDADGTIIADDGSGNALWAIWPIGGYNLEPGKKYTFTIDLAGGGYFETNKDSDADLDPILEGAEIRFTNVTIDSWTEVSRTSNDVYLSQVNSTDYLGWIITSDGCVYQNKTAVDEAGKTGIAMIVYFGAAGTADTSPGAESYKGLAIALSNATACDWCNQSEEACLENIITNNIAEYYADMKGIQKTRQLQEHATHTHPAANSLKSYAAVAPSETSGWFLPSAGQWSKFIYDMCGVNKTTNVGLDLVNNKFVIAGYPEANFVVGSYWSSTEIEDGYIMNIYSVPSSNNLYYISGPKTGYNYNPRPFLAF